MLCGEHYSLVWDVSLRAGCERSGVFKARLKVGKAKDRFLHAQTVSRTALCLMSLHTDTFPICRVIHNSSAQLVLQSVEQVAWEVEGLKNTLYVFQSWATWAVHRLRYTHEARSHRFNTLQDVNEAPWSLKDWNQAPSVSICCSRGNALFTSSITLTFTEAR